MSGNEIMKSEYSTKTAQFTYRPKVIVSGMQSGADQGGLKGARACGIATSGWAPKGYRTEYGPDKHFGLQFNIKEHPSADYPPRTKQNVNDADATLIVVLSSVPERGSKFTEDFCKNRKPCLVLKLPATSCSVTPYVEQVCVWLAEHQPGILNIAGNRESVSPGIENWTRKLIMELFR